MKDFFTHKQKNALEDRIYYFENYKDIYCKARRTYHAVKHKVSWTGKDGCTYETKRIKGSCLAEIFSNYGTYKRLRFEIIKKNKDTAETVGRVFFPKAGHICLLVGNNKFYVQSYGEGWYSLKKNDKQTALFLQEPFAEGGYYKYCVWYEPECHNYMGFFMFLLTMTDYMFYRDSTGTGRQQYNVYCSKKAAADEIYWRPSDTKETSSKEEEQQYFEKLNSRRKEGRILAVWFFILLFIVLAFISFCFLYG
ncbi:MAG: hypothetical protein LUC92_01105 [Clostridiales bacterium]|nr:hypothetical protein [Clostridiales bacterium]